MEPMMPLPISETMANLSNLDIPLPSSSLTDLSNLSREDLDVFEQKWAAIEPKRRRQIVSRLVELAEDNIELNFDSIYTVCLKDDDAEIRAQAIEGLWENEDPALINRLINLFENDTSDKVRATAATALGKYSMLAECGKLRPDYLSRIEKALLPIINDDDSPLEIRRRALESAAPLSHPEIKQAIMEAHQSQYQKLRVSAVHAMGKNCDPSWLPILLQELDNLDAEIRYEAAGACGEIGDESATHQLADLIDDPDSDVRLAAVQALGKIGGPGAKEILTQSLKNPSRVLRQAAEQALTEIKMWEGPLPFTL